MLLEHLQTRLAAQQAQALQRRRRIVAAPCRPHAAVSAPAGVGMAPPQARLAFCSNDYLGLAAHPLLAGAWAEGAARHGVGSGGSALIGGHSPVHAALEERLALTQAAHVPQAKALVFGSGFMANLAVVSALADASTTFFSEALNHASLIDGLRLARAGRAQVQVFAHADTQALEALLAQCTQPIKIIVTDAVFSMDGDLAPLADWLALAERHDAWLLLDDAHGFGVLGAQGRGVLEHLGLRSQRLIYVGTLSKAAGQQGGFVVAHRVVIDWLVQAARPYIYTTAMPPAQAHALLVGMDLIEGAEGQQRRAHLRALIGHWRAAMQARLTHLPGVATSEGWRLLPSATPIQPLVVGQSDAALALSAWLDAVGLWVPAIRPPTVPAGQARLRIALSAAHTLADVDRLVTALAQARGGADWCAEPAEACGSAA
ncbi:aminotransferase class I/II-fold pyridoxal phosphate-dependent enzyme [Ottowia testudinis]|uniref:8-amino-7-oxononanoate synthase n=1 Tax=Ottowia testudinis TaxID=2816950 RepID=A0A975H429_9BURK|nr:8-amino-7-oxononanoate synthase [Ottowia testudinis]QTD45930.1 8-amino-7-oxononanoate synthase [Ottowia testudinis]